MNKSVYIALAVLAIVAFGAGYGCGHDSEIHEIVEATKATNEKLEAQKDSIQFLLTRSRVQHTQDSLRIVEADAARSFAERRSRRTELALQRIPRYDTLSNDDLARRASAVYLQRTSGATDPD